MRKNNYDKLAPIYDFVSHAVYGQALVKAQRSVLHAIENGQKILIVGGGTGWILDEIEKLNKKNISVSYMEASSKMIELAKKRRLSFPVEFICQYAEDIDTTKKWDVIMTPFFFDNFQKKKGLFLLEKLDNALNTGGLFLYVDFRLTKENVKFWKKALLKTMYLFFRFITHIETNTLVDMASILEKKYQKNFTQYSFHDFVFAGIYIKK